jgi:signal transduction histidine kinase
LLETRLSDDQSEYVRVIERTAEGLISLVNDVLTYTRADQQVCDGSLA